jgi:hypothetical protein
MGFGNPSAQFQSASTAAAESGSGPAAHAEPPKDPRVGPVYEAHGAVPVIPDSALFRRTEFGGRGMGAPLAPRVELRRLRDAKRREASSLLGAHAL